MKVKSSLGNRLVSVALASAIFWTGCATVSKKQGEDDGLLSAGVMGGLIGMAAGLGIGAAAGGGKTALWAAGAGLACGLITGVVWKKHIVLQRAKYAEEEKYFAACLEDAKQKRNAMAAINSAFEEGIQAAERSFNEGGPPAGTKRRLYKRNVEGNINAAGDFDQNLIYDIELQKAALKRATAGVASAKLLGEEIGKLETERERLKNCAERMAKIKARLG